MLGTSGYLLDGKPVLYDHETESLWTENGDSLAAIAGRYKGKRLPRLASPRPSPGAPGKPKTLGRDCWSAPTRTPHALPGRQRITIL